MKKEKVIYDGLEFDTIPEAFQEFLENIKNNPKFDFETEDEAYQYFIDNEIDKESQKKEYELRKQNKKLKDRS